MDLFLKVKAPNVVLAIFFLMPFFSLYSQTGRNVFVDRAGVMRWGDSKKEVYGFGVNYTAPFAHAYRSARRLGVDLEKEISNDVYHFARLGFDAYRVHVWDCEISDSLGNLLKNEHLRLFDFMLWKMKERGIKILLTPIAFWGNGYPEPEEKTPGFSTKYGKDACLTNADAIRAQENYLFQFLNHVNPYTKTAYKDDPDIIAFEVSNEPHHKGKPEEVTTYINRMVGSMKKTGCQKPIFYNVSHSIHLSRSYYKADIDGGTFQWYPTGLGAAHELRGNFLPNVDRYEIPFADESGFKSGAKIVYEFDAADIGRSYIYPAMARSFRTAGIQWATHFAYDPTYMAYANTEYNTHYMNLVYAPQKALSLKIASEVFHEVPRYKDYGRYPQNTSFENFRVSYEEDLAEYVTATKFLYTNHTKTIPPAPSSLSEIAGYGSSAVVTYEGTGAYFLDKINNGVWRLEILPDAIWVNNLFGRNSLDRRVAVINYRAWPIRISLPDLTNEFSISDLKNGAAEISANSDALILRPGVYLLKRKGISTPVRPNDQWKNIRLNEYAASASTLSKNYVLHSPFYETSVSEPLTISAKIITLDQPDSVTLYAYFDTGMKRYPMRRLSGYDYQTEIPAVDITKGFLNYHITVFQNHNRETFPSGSDKSVTDWDFAGESYQTRVVNSSSPLTLFDTFKDAPEVSREWRKGSKVYPGKGPNSALLRVEVRNLHMDDQENLKEPVITDYSLRYNFAPKIVGRRKELADFKTIILKGNSITKDFPLQIALIDRQGNAFGKVLTLSTSLQDHAISLRDFLPVRMVTLPRPYPTFLPYFFERGENVPGMMDIKNIETLQISVGPEIVDPSHDFRFNIESIRLEK